MSDPVEITEPKLEPFWFVFADEGGRLDSYEKAEAAARARLALNPRGEFFVLRAVARVTAEPLIEVEAIDGQAQPAD